MSCWGIANELPGVTNELLGFANDLLGITNELPGVTGLSVEFDRSTACRRSGKVGLGEALRTK